MARPTPVEVRTRVQEEHAAIRRSLVAVVESGTAALRDESACETLARELMELSDLLERHLAYEEQMLAPILAVTDAWGCERVDGLNNEHRTMRAMLVALLEDVRSGARHVRELVDEVRWFADAVRRDIDEEERTQLETIELGEDGCVVVTDQIDG